MNFRYEDPRFITAVVLMGFGAFVLRARLKKQVQIDWPLIFWLLIIWFANSFEGFFNVNLLYAGLITSLILRFEFMADKLAAFLAIVESLIICVTIFLGLRGVQII